MNWREVGDVPYAVWSGTITGAGGPAELASKGAWQSATPHSALLLAMMGEENRWGTTENRNTLANKNALNMRPPLRPDGTREPGDYLRFDSWTVGIAACVARITSKTYGGGVYARTTTLDELVAVFAPANDDNDPAAYAAFVRGCWRRWGVREMATGLVFGQVRHPPFVDRLIPDRENGAWDDLGPRAAMGVCQHSMIGTLLGTDRWFRRGGQSNGLTDYGIGNDTDGPALDGVIYRWNDPEGKPHKDVSANRAGWANGGSDGLEGDGPLFVRTFGIGAINRDLVSIERSDGGNTARPMSAKQFASIVALTAHWFDRARVPYTTFPLNPAKGVVTHFLHKEFATKDCPFPPVYDRIDEIQNAVRGLLKAGQTHTDGTPIPPVEPPEPDHGAFPNGWTEAALRKRFGQIVRVAHDGGEAAFGFDPKGPISNAWVARGASEGMTRVTQLPKPLLWREMRADANQHAGIIIFDRFWTLYRPTATTAWRWVR